jgi:RNA polymerase sigma-70 factor, ECF subfamily
MKEQWRALVPSLTYFPSRNFMQPFNQRCVSRNTRAALFYPESVVKKYECMALDKFSNETSAEVLETVVEVESLSDHQLIEAVRVGDEEAFAEIVNRYRSAITNYLFRFLNDYEEAVDLAQETFVRVYFAVERYHTDYAFSTYIYRIATNLAISELRKRKRRKLISLTGLFQFGAGEEEKDFHPPDMQPLPDENLLEDEQSRMIARAIEALPEKYRAPIVLRDVQGKSYDEVAQILGLGLGTTKSRINRARGLLREKLKNYF